MSTKWTEVQTIFTDELVNEYEELEKRIADLSTQLAAKDEALKDMCGYVDKCAVLEYQNEILRAALEKYADKKSWAMFGAWIGEGSNPRGIAQDALAKVKETL